MTLVLDGSAGITGGAGALLAQSSYPNTITSGLVSDYTSGIGRLSVGSGESLVIYRGGIGTSESLRIDSSGNVGINMTPTYKLDVTGSTRSSTSTITGSSTVNSTLSASTFTFASNVSSTFSFLKPTSTASLSYRYDITTGGLNSIYSGGFWNGWHFAPPDAITNASSGSEFPRTAHYYTYSSTTNPSDLTYNIICGNSTVAHNMFIAAGANGYLLLGVGAAEKMRIDSSGNVSIGSAIASPSLLNVNKYASTSTTDYSANFISSGSTVNAGRFLWSQNSTYALAVAVAGSGGGSGYADFQWITRSSGVVNSSPLTMAFSGNIGINTSSPAVSLHVNTTDAMRIPVGTTAQQPTGAAGYLRYNSTLSQFEGHNGTAWGAIGAGATGGAGNYVFFENDTTVTTNYTITSNKNAMTAGPVTVADNITVTIPSGSTWTIV